MDMQVTDLGRVKLGSKYFQLVAKELPNKKRIAGQDMMTGLGTKIDTQHEVEWQRMNGAVRMVRHAWMESTEDGNYFYVLIGGNRVDIPPLF